MMAPLSPTLGVGLKLFFADKVIEYLIDPEPSFGN
jgi:hypothetical protein